VVYGDGVKDAAAAAGRLQSLGYRDVSLLAGGLAGWVAGGGEPGRTRPGAALARIPSCSPICTLREA